MEKRKIVYGDLEMLSRTLCVAAPELEKTLRSLAVCIYEPGDVIVKEGTVGTDVYVVRHGKVSVRHSRWFVLSKEVAELRPGDLFGEIGFLMPTTRTASIVAKGHCEVCCMVLNEFKELLTRHSDLRFKVEEMARRRLYSLSSALQS
ncbi:MAG: cyclic nucleotide-binding domain-containing protein [Elusimicrobia bacterium]|nr:cyclic nucleotide-binding domain-containing protein [Elusimicrobiota bacterium]